MHGKFNFIFLLDANEKKNERESSGSHNKNKVHIIGSLCPVDGLYACASAHIYKTTIAWNKKVGLGSHENAQIKTRKKFQQRRALIAEVGSLYVFV